MKRAVSWWEYRAPLAVKIPLGIALSPLMVVGFFVVVPLAMLYAVTDLVITRKWQW